MIDFYFRRPLLWDFILGSVLSGLLTYIFCQNQLLIPDRDKLNGIVSDLSTISLTLAGFVLTLLTVLISYKSSFEDDKGAEGPKNTFQYFFATSFYFQTVRHLKEAILSLTVIALLGYILKLTIPDVKNFVLFGFDIFGVCTVFFTLWRCLTILSKIIKLQEEYQRK
jgi:hypothetical protein